VYVDLSYFSEALTADSAERARLATAFRKFIAEFDRDARHILFGTDWVMLGKESNHASYTIAVVDFLRRDCELDETRIQRILSENAVDFLGLRVPSHSRERILSFYRRHDLPETRFLQVAKVA
jgi:hypothetical protein